MIMIIYQIYTGAEKFLLILSSIYRRQAKGWIKVQIEGDNDSGDMMVRAMLIKRLIHLMELNMV